VIVVEERRSERFVDEGVRGLAIMQWVYVDARCGEAVLAVSDDGDSKI
jgi:hypothetical protein